MARRTIEHRDFSGGDWGRRKPWNAPPNTFSGSNMLLYRTGELGVRPGIRDVTPTDAVAGGVVALSAPAPAQANNIFFVQGTKLKRFLPTRGASTTTTLTGDFTNDAAAATQPTVFNSFVGSLLYIAAGTLGVYEASGGALTKLTSDVDALGIVQYGDRLAICQYTDSNKNILRFNGTSAGVSVFTSWPAANIIPVGNRSQFSMFNVQKTHLSIGQPTGIYVLTGALGVSESLRQAVASTKGPGESTLTVPTVMDNAERIWYFAHPNLTPMFFDGTNYVEFTDLRIPWTNSNSGGHTWTGGIQPGLATFPTTDDDGVIYLCPGKRDATTVHYPARALIRYNGAWTQHDFTTTDVTACLEGAVQSIRAWALPDPSISQTAVPYEDETLVDQFILLGQTSPDAPKFYSLIFGLDRPGYSYPNNGTGYSGTGYYDVESAGDNSTEQVSGWFDLPETHLADADEFRVAGVIVDFRSFNTNGTLTNHFDIQVDCLRTYNNSPITSLTESWDEAGSLSAADGTLKRRAFMFGDQGLGNGYQLKLSNCRGVSFLGFEVIIETTKARGF